jgi:hypothetical protein
MDLSPKDFKLLREMAHASLVIWGGIGLLFLWGRWLKRPGISRLERWVYRKDKKINREKIIKIRKGFQKLQKMDRFTSKMAFALLIIFSGPTSLFFLFYGSWKIIILLLSSGWIVFPFYIFFLLLVRTDKGKENSKLETRNSKLTHS